MSHNPEDPALQPTGKFDAEFDDAAIKRARELLTAMPENVGPYRILERIGGGGMGDVYRAEQRSPIRRQVALKFIKLGMDSKAVITRFEAERQALALMDHPHIAKVFDAGTDDTGRPYFVMEYVKGKPITDYSDQNHLNIAERLKLFEQVCQAVQHAHHKGVIHRDLKPGNVLVSTQDGEPFAKVIDFGVAKAISQNLTEGTLFTQHDQFIGTPQYMSPEQAGGSVDIDTRTDVYSLGVLLYELLTGSTPFSTQELKAAAFEQIKRMIIENDPPKPSTRLSPNTPTLSSLASFRRTEPKRLGMLVQGELDWIVMKSIDKDRRRRYETPTSLANDILAHLKGEPVQAAPPSTAYRIQKFVRKNRSLVIGVASVMTALLIGVFGTTWGLVRARIAESSAIDSERKKDVALGLVTEERDAKEKQRQLAEAAKTAESKQRETAERHLVSGILRPIGFNDAFGAAELRSLNDWSMLGDTRIQLLALEVAFEDPVTALRIARRAERVVQSCVALSPTRRAKAIEFVSAKQRDRDTDPCIRTAACWLAMELGSPDLPVLEESILYLADPANNFATELQDFLAFALSQGDLTDSAGIVSRLGIVLAKLLRESKEYSPLREASWGLVKLAQRLPSEQIPYAWDSLSAILENPEWPTKDRPHIVYAVGEGLSTLAIRLSPEQAARAGDSITAILEAAREDEVIIAAGKAIAGLVPRLTPDQITRVGDSFIERLEKTTSNQSMNAIDSTLSAVAHLLSMEQISRIAIRLNSLIERSNDQYVREAAGRLIGTLVLRLNREQVTSSVDRLIEWLERCSTDGIDLDLNSDHSANYGLFKLIQRLDTNQQEIKAKRLISLLESSPNSYVQIAIRRALVAIAPSLSPKTVMQAFNAIIEGLENPRNRWNGGMANQDLFAFARCLTIQQVNDGFTLIEILETSTDELRRHAAIYGVLALAPRLNSIQARRFWDVLFATTEESTDKSIWADQVGRLIGLVPQLEPMQITQAQEALFAVLEKSNDWHAKVSALKGLAALAPQMDSTQLARYGEVLITVLEKSTVLNVHSPAYDGLVELVPRLEPTQVMRAWEALFEVLGYNTGMWSKPLSTGKGLAALAMKMDVIVRERVVEQAVEMFCDLTASDESQSFQIRPIDGGFDIVKTASNPRSLAKLLSHPGCVGTLRQVMLSQFEELALHGGQPVLSQAGKQDGEPPTPGSMPQRQFHNLHEAAAWIQSNWPDFDLETNHPVNWRAEAARKETLEGRE